MPNLYPFQEECVAKLVERQAVLTAYGGVLEGLQSKLFWSKFEIAGNGCWIWTRALGGQGFYGTYAWRWTDQNNIKRKNQKPTHIISYLINVGEIPKGLILDHLCREHKCGNPKHLEPVTNKENQNRGKNGKLKTHCVNDHPYVEDNIYTDPRGFRECKTCRYDAVIAYRSRKGVV